MIRIDRNRIREIRDRIDQLISRFDTRQRGAVNATLDEWNSASDSDFVLPIVDGPPGTGKTTVATTAVAQYLSENPREQVLYMCYTNFAAEQAMRRLLDLGFDHTQLVRISSNPSEQRDGVVGFRSEDELRSTQRNYLRGVPVLICTLHRARIGSKYRRDGTRVIIDEFSQVNVPIFFATLYRLKDLNPRSFALFGDPYQLPIVTTQPLLYQNICSYIRGRISQYDPIGLVTQYRMHETVCSAVNQLRRALGTYEIRTADRVRDQDLTSLGYRWIRTNTSPNFWEILDPQYPVVIVNTDHLQDSNEVRMSTSWVNPGEARLAVRLAEEFNRSFIGDGGERLRPMILSPYSAQVYEIRRLFQNYLENIGECTTIYRAQGREYPCVILSFVRNNPHGFIGFLQEPQLRAQTYVACSRAQAKLIILMSFRTFLNAGHVDFDYLYRTPGARIIDRLSL